MIDYSGGIHKLNPSYIREKIQSLCDINPSEEGMRVAQLLEDWVGLHHIDEHQFSKVDWTASFMSLTIPRSMSLATFDFDTLTRLVFLAHDHCIRVEIEPCNFEHLRLVFHPRKKRHGSINDVHPYLAKAHENWAVNKNRIFYEEQIECVFKRGDTVYFTDSNDSYGCGPYFIREGKVDEVFYNVNGDLMIRILADHNLGFTGKYDAETQTIDVGNTPARKDLALVRQELEEANA